MLLSDRKIAITGAGRGLGAALAIVAADKGMTPVLLGRNPENLDAVAGTIERRTARRPGTIPCDLADPTSVARAADALISGHADVDAIVHNGAMWLPGPLEDLTDEQMCQCVGSAVTGALILTRRLLPLLKSRPRADIHTVVSISGLPNVRLLAASVAFRAAKAGQDGFVQGLAEELSGTSVRVSAVYPGNIEDISPNDPAWVAPRGPRDPLTNREVVDCILFTLAMPPNVSIRTLVIERADSDTYS
ncbi:MAG: SDR family oxidoreductase [Hyphomicrobiaceae bacterium]